MTEVNVTEKKQSKAAKWIDDNRSNLLVLLIGVPTVLVFFYPLFSGRVSSPSYFLFSLTLVFIYAAMTLSLNLEVGYLGIPNFGKVAFIAVGGYTYAITLDRLSGKYREGQALISFGNFDLAYTQGFLIVFGLFMSIVVTGIFGFLLTIPTLRLREDYLAIVTIVAGEIIRVVAFNEETFGGFDGFFVDNPVVIQYPASIFLSGVFLTIDSLLLVLFVYGTIFAIYLLQTRGLDKSDFEAYDMHKNKMSRNSVFATIIVIMFDYFRPNLSVVGFKLFEEPSIGLHLSLLGLSFGVLIYNAYLKNRLFAGEFFAIMSGFAFVNYIAGISTSDKGLDIFGMIIDNKTNIRTNEWFGMLFALLVLMFIYVIMEEIASSPFGRTLRAIREDDTSAISVGKSIFAFRLRALIIAAAITGLAGAVFAQIITIVSPLQYLPLLTFTLYIMLIIGGTGNNKGAIFGAVIIQLLFQITRGTLFQDSVWFYPNLSTMVDNSKELLLFIIFTIGILTSLYVAIDYKLNNKSIDLKLSFFKQPIRNSSFIVFIMIIASGLAENADASNIVLEVILMGLIYAASISLTVFIISTSLLKGNQINHTLVAAGSAWLLFYLLDFIFSEIVDQPLINNPTVNYIDSDRQIAPFNIGLIFVGVMLIVFLIYAPEGIIPEVKKNNPKYYNLIKYYENKEEEDSKAYEFLKSLINAEETEEWI